MQAAQSENKKRWEVTETEPKPYGVSQNKGYGFSILTIQGMPLLEVTYKTKSEAQEAEEAIRQALGKAMQIDGYQ